MMRKIIPSIIVMLSLLIACAESPESQPPSSSPAPAPALAPAPVSIPAPIGSLPQSKPTPEADIPEISEEEMAAFLWGKIPNNLPDGYTKSQFLPQTRKATYIDNQKWEFRLSGTGSDSTLLPLRNYEKTPGNWVESHSREVTTYNLVLTANYYEETDTLDILGIQKLDEKTTVETISEKSIIGKGLKLEYIMAGSYTGFSSRFEGAVKNIGCVPLENVIIEISIFDENGNLLRTDNTTLSPSKINVGENASFALEIKYKFKIDNEGHILGSYTGRFLLPSGEQIYLELPE